MLLDLSGGHLFRRGEDGMALIARIKPAQEFLVGITFYRYSPNQLPNKVLAIKPAFASTFVYANFQDLVPYFLTRDHSR